MKRTIPLRPVPFTARSAAMLEERSLIRTLKPTPRVLGCPQGRGMMEQVYTSSVEHGSHKLACIRCSCSRLQLNSHPDNEEFIFINTNGNRFRPLYLAIGLHKHRLFQQRMAAGTLRPEDIILLAVPYNDPRVSVFTMLRDTVHAELVPPGDRQAPIFFVSEPSKLRMRKLDMWGYDFCLKE